MKRLQRTWVKTVLLRKNNKSRMCLFTSLLLPNQHKPLSLVEPLSQHLCLHSVIKYNSLNCQNDVNYKWKHVTLMVKTLQQISTVFKTKPNYNFTKAREDLLLSELAYLFCIMSSLSSLSCALTQLVPKRPEILFCNKALNLDQPITIHTEHLLCLMSSQFTGCSLDITFSNGLFLTSLNEVDSCLFLSTKLSVSYFCIYLL